MDVYQQVDKDYCNMSIGKIEPLTQEPKGNIYNTEIRQSALATQVGGDHYKKLKIQPMEYAMANNLDPCQQTAIKYITRFRDKGGIADLRKAIHTIEMLIEFEEKKDAL